MEAELSKKLKVPIAVPEEIDGSLFPCPVDGCSKVYNNKQSLDGHLNANHWKGLNSKKRGKP